MYFYLKEKDVFLSSVYCKGSETMTNPAQRAGWHPDCGPETSFSMKSNQSPSGECWLQAWGRACTGAPGTSFRGTGQAKKDLARGSCLWSWENWITDEGQNYTWVDHIIDVYVPLGPWVHCDTKPKWLTGHKWTILVNQLTLPKKKEQ